MSLPPPRKLVVAEGICRKRADKVLATACPELSRAAVQRAFDAGLVSVGGIAIDKSHKLSGGEVIDYSLPETRPSELVPNPIALDILFEDDDLIAINKPPGMVVHPGAGTGGDTLVHALLAHCAGQLSGIGGVERPGIVHRLDRETSGVIIAAKTDAAHRALARSFAQRKTEKEYLALVAGVPTLLSGSILKPIIRHSAHRHRMTIAEEGRGRTAHTDWQRETVFGTTTALLRCRIHTGRTHQIRVHLKSIGHAIIGDRVYGWRPDPRDNFPVSRTLLHAARLVVAHPIAGTRVEFSAPLPPDFTALIDHLQRRGS